MVGRLCVCVGGLWVLIWNVVCVCTPCLCALRACGYYIKHGREDYLFLDLLDVSIDLFDIFRWKFAMRV